MVTVVNHILVNNKEEHNNALAAWHVATSFGEKIERRRRQGQEQTTHVVRYSKLNSSCRYIHPVHQLLKKLYRKETLSLLLLLL